MEYYLLLLVCFAWTTYRMRFPNLDFFFNLACILSTPRLDIRCFIYRDVLAIIPRMSNFSIKPMLTPPKFVPGIAAMQDSICAITCDTRLTLVAGRDRHDPTAAL